MSLTIKQVAEAHLVLTELVNKDSEPLEKGGGFLPYQTKLKIGTLFRKLKTDNDTFENERRELAKVYGEPIYANPEDKESPVVGYKLPKDGQKKLDFEKKFNELIASEADLAEIKPIPADILGENKLSEPFIRQLQDVGVLSIPTE